MKSAEIRGVRALFRGLLRLVLVAAATTSASLTLSSNAHAYAWLIKHRYGGCPTCHADPSGGELLTSYGRQQGELLLKMPYGDTANSASGSKVSSGGSDADSFDSFDSVGASTGAAGGDSAGKTAAPAAAAGPVESEASEMGTGAFLWGVTLPDSLLMGGGFRMAALKKTGALKFFPMMADVYGQLTLGHFRGEASIGITRAPAGSPNGRPAQITTNQDDGTNLISRTHWLGYEFGGNKYLLRAGRINLPFGLRIPEHVMWVRDITRTDRESDQQHGVALAYNADNLRAEVMAIAGNYQVNPDKYRERGYSGYLEGMLDEQNAFGVSSLWTTAGDDRIANEHSPHARSANGVFWRMTLAEPLVVFGEADILTNSLRDTGYVGLLQADYEVIQGLHLIGSAEVLDQGYKFARPGATPGPTLIVPGAGKPNTGFWASADWYFFSHMSLRVDGIFRHTDPTTILAQLHVYL